MSFRVELTETAYADLDRLMTFLARDDSAFSARASCANRMEDGNRT
jgi:hypothetical protein